MKPHTGRNLSSHRIEEQRKTVWWRDLAVQRWENYGDESTKQKTSSLVIVYVIVSRTGREGERLSQKGVEGFVDNAVWTVLLELALGEQTVLRMLFFLFPRNLNIFNVR